MGRWPTRPASPGSADRGRRHRDSDLLGSAVHADDGTCAGGVLDGIGQKLVDDQRKRHVAFAAPYPGKIVAVEYVNLDGVYHCVRAVVRTLIRAGASTQRNAPQIPPHKYCNT